MIRPPSSLIANMEMQCTCFGAAVRRYVEELLPLLAAIHDLSHSSSAAGCSSSLTVADKAKLVKHAADMCLVKAAGPNAIWGKALHKTLTDSEKPARRGHADCSEAEAMTRRRSLCAKISRRCHQRYRLCRSSKSRCGYGFLNGRLRCFRHGNLTLHYRLSGVRALSSSSMQCSNLYRRKLSKTCRTVPSCLRSSPLLTMTKRVTALPDDRPACKVHVEPASNLGDKSSRLQALKNVIPGGAALLDIASLFEEAALYILALQMQVQSLSALATMNTT